MTNINNWDFYRKIRLALEEPKLKKRHLELEKTIKESELEIKRLQSNIKINENELAHVEAELKDQWFISIDESQLVSIAGMPCYTAKLFLCNERIANLSKILQVESRDGIIKFGFRRIEAPPGAYYLFVTYTDDTFMNIYEFGEDAYLYYTSVWTLSKSKYCQSCHRNKTYLSECRFTFLDKGRYRNNSCYICEKCMDSGARKFKEYVAEVQKAYHAYMNYNLALPLLLYARSRLPDNALHKDNLPLDLFKVITRMVFPPAFLAIK